MTTKYGSEKGQSLVEYGLVLVLVAIVIAAILAIFGDTVKGTYCRTTYMLAPDTDLSETCQAPIVMSITSHNGNAISVEARVHDPDGNPNAPYAAIDRVEFYIDDVNSTPVIIEYQYRYCLGAGDGNATGCGTYYNISGLSSGSHEVIMLAYDDDGNVGQARYRFTKD